MATKVGIFMIADGLEVEDIEKGVIFKGKIEKLDRVANLNVVLSFWGTTVNPANGFNLIDELRKFEETLEEDDNVLIASEKIKKYFEELAILDENDNLGFHVCGYIGDEAHIHHVHHIVGFENNHFKNEDSKQEFHSRRRIIEYPILFNGENIIPNLFVNLLTLLNDKIDYTEFNRDKAKEFLIFLIKTAIKLQDFSLNSLTFGTLIGYPLRFCEITMEGIRIEIIQKDKNI